MCDAATLVTPDDLDGESLWPTLTGASPLHRHKPMVWVFPEYGGQVAVRIGQMKVVRQYLTNKRPGDWEVYDLGHDRGERSNIADRKPDVIQAEQEILRRQTDDNQQFPLKVLD